MKNITILDDSFDLNLSAIYHISIQLSFSGYSFCILNTIRSRYIALKHFNFSQALTIDNFNKEIKKLLETDEFLNKRYKSVKFAWVSTKYTFVPSEIFKDEDASQLLAFNANLDSFEEMEKAKVAEGSLVQLFAFPTYLSTVLSTHYKDVRIYNQTTSFINAAIKVEKTKKSELPVVYAEILGKQINIAVTSFKGLILANSFECRNENDFIYHLLNVYEQLKLTPNLNELIVSGDFPMNSALFNLIKKYVKNVSLAQPSGNFTYSESFSDIPPYIFTNLFNLYECE
jgi:hypothetical protein